MFVEPEVTVTCEDINEDLCEADASGYEAEQHNNGVVNMSAYGFHPYAGFRVKFVSNWF